MKSERRVGCIGKFDALHLGHRALLLRAAELGRPVLLGFRDLARTLGWPARPPLWPPADRAEVLADWGVDAIVRDLDFPRIRDLTPAAFVRLLVDEENLTGVVVGRDFRFGRDRRADSDALRRLAEGAGLECAVLPPVLVDGRKVASSDVRRAVDTGDVATAGRLLGRPYRLLGRVVAGARFGRHLGRPTANCGDPANLVPGPGVYAGRARLGSADRGWAAAINIGRRPSVTRHGGTTVEAHLLDYDGDCYGEEIRLAFHRRLREERRFADAAELGEQIARDVAAVRALLD